MLRLTWPAIVLALATMLATAASGASEPSTLPDGICDRCGCGSGVRKVCVAKPVVREKKTVCWDAECVPHCIPGKSEYCGICHGSDECGCYEYEVWKPTCARVATKTVPVKREVTRKVPGIEWTVEEQCVHCRQCEHPAPPAAGRLPYR